MVDIARLDDGALGNIGKKRKFFPHFVIERILGAGDDDSRLQTDLAQLGHALLGRFGFQFARRLDEGHERDVDEHGVRFARFEQILADRLEERQTLDVARRAPDLDDGHIGGTLRGQLADTRFDFVGHVRNNLHGFSQVIAAALAGQHALVDLAARQVVAAAENAIGEALIMPEIQIGLGSIVEHIDLAMLVRAHRARVDVQIRVELAHGHTQPAALEQRAERSSGQSFAQRTDHAPGDKNGFHENSGSAQQTFCLGYVFRSIHADRALLD